MRQMKSLPLFFRLEVRSMRKLTYQRPSLPPTKAEWLQQSLTCFCSLLCEFSVKYGGFEMIKLLASIKSEHSFISAQTNFNFEESIPFFTAFLAAKLMHFLLMSTNVPLIAYYPSSYFIRLKPIAPVPHPKSINLTALPFFHFFLIYSIAFSTKNSVSNLGISTGGFKINFSSLKGHSPTKYCIGQCSLLALSILIAYIIDDHTQAAANTSSLLFFITPTPPCLAFSLAR